MKKSVLTSLEKTFMMADSFYCITTGEELTIGIVDRKCSGRFYIDNRTKWYPPVDGYLVLPIAESERFFWYICPHCGKIHMESKKSLDSKNRVLTRCSKDPALFYVTMLMEEQHFIDMDKPITEDEQAELDKFYEQ